MSDDALTEGPEVPAAAAQPPDLHSRVQRAAMDRRVANWLFVVAGMIFLMVVVGGATRLTGSGLSMVEWRPVTGILPPMGDAEWAQEFAKYQQHPEFQYVNKWMSVHDFKQIFWLEYIHRVIARVIGFVFFVPFLWFWWKGHLRKKLVAPLAGIFILGGLQGAMGWFMVMSGLVDEPSVSHFRLAAHLGLAVILYLAVLWTAWGLVAPRYELPRPASLYKPAIVLTCLVFGQILLGALVAGLDAGYIHNTWPSMDGHFLPPGVWVMQPGILNMVDNGSLVQFEHRTVAYIITAFVLWIVYRASRLRRGRAPRAVQYMVMACLLQVGLGIATVVSGTPVALGVLHQAGAIVFLTAALYLVHRLKAADRTGALA